MTKGKTGRRLWPVLKVTGLTLLSMVVLLAVAQLGLSYYGEADSLRRAFYRARWFWLVLAGLAVCVVRSRGGWIMETVSPPESQ
ncbi:TPA: hypothetical protein ACKRIK_000781 [Proteus mirabilis]